jgi:YD repeat-containing protein
MSRAGQRKNGQGQTVSVTDAQSHSSTYVYDPFSNLKQGSDAASNVTTYSYDTRGRKITSNGPDRHHQPDFPRLQESRGARRPISRGQRLWQDNAISVVVGWATL